MKPNKPEKNDWVGLGTSLAVHLVLVFLMSLMVVAATDEVPVGFIEVEFGQFSEGRPTVRAPERVVPQPEPPVEAEPEEIEKPAVAPPEEVRPVDLPDVDLDIPDEEIIAAPDAETIQPEEIQAQEEIVDEIPEPETQTIQPLGSGSIDATDGAQLGDEGTSNEPTRASPFQIEGLNRAAINSPLPVNSANVSTIITMQITVNPQGRIIQRVPIRKGNPQLEQEVMRALLRWRFNPLPPNAPQEAQTGKVTFRFTLR